MLKTRLLAFGLLATLAAAPAFAQTVTPTPPAAPTTPSVTPPAATAPVAPVGSGLNRDVNQQNRIEQGLQSGQLSTGEAAHLENGEQRIDNAESNALKNGDTPAEQAHIQQMENRESQQITKDDNNKVTGNPNSASSQRMQADVQRNINQQNRINQGMQSGSLTNNEAAHLEKGQARTDKAEAVAGKNGHVSAAEQRRIQNKQNRQSRHIYRAKHNKRSNTSPQGAASTPSATTAQ